MVNHIKWLTVSLLLEAVTFETFATLIHGSSGITSGHASMYLVQVASLSHELPIAYLLLGQS